QKTGDHSELNLLSSRNDFTSDVAAGDISTTHLRTYQYDEQLLHQVDWADGRMKSTYGFDYQSVKAYSPQAYPGSSGGSQSLRTYLNQTTQIVPHILWVGAFSWDARNNGKPDPNYQLSQLWDPIENQ